MKKIFAFSLAAAITASPLLAENTRAIEVVGTIISIPIPEEYVDRSSEMNAPARFAYFGKKEPGSWEEQGEVSDNILVYGLGFKPVDEAVKQQKFEAIFNRVQARIQARMDGKIISKVEPDAEALISTSLVESIFKQSYGDQAYAMEITDNRPNRKAILIDSKMVMTGVFTFPMIEEISFVRANDLIIIAHASGLDIGKLKTVGLDKINVRKRLKAASAAIRDGLQTQN